MGKFIKLIAASLMTGAGVVAQATDRFVSDSGDWTMPDHTGVCYTDLQAAVDAAATGETVWIKDGYVCEKGKQAAIGNGGFFPRIDIPNKMIVLRSESGFVDEKAGKGATIRGEPDSGFDGTDAVPKGCGTNGVRPIRVRNENTVLLGLILENGYTGDAHNYGAGGAIYGGCIVSNCVIRNCKCYCGGAVAGSNAKLYDSVVSNCYAFGSGYGGGAVFGGASLYNCTIADNSALKTGGAVYYNNNGTDYNTVYSNCVFRGNVAASCGAVALTKFDASTKRIRMVDCQVLNNRATLGGWGGVCGAVTMTRCTIAGNETRHTSSTLANGGGVGATGVSAPSGTWPILEDCVISNNFAQVSGGGLYCGFASDCTFISNWSCGDGGGAYRSVMTNCRFVGNVASNIVNTSNSPFGNGGGCADCTATNCVFFGNAAWAQNLVASGNGGGVANSDLFNCVISNNWSAYRGAAVYNVNRATEPYRCYNCLIVGNTSAAPHVGYDRGMIIEGESANTLAANPAEFYNCTIADNSAPNYAVINDVKLFNCVVWGNTAPLGEFFPKQVWADHTCQKDLAPGTDSANLNVDPRFNSGYRTGRSVRNKGLIYPWMADEGDVRAKDLAGNPRVLDGLPDLGCYEPLPAGWMIIVR